MKDNSVSSILILGDKVVQKETYVFVDFMKELERSTKLLALLTKLIWNIYHLLINFSFLMYNIEAACLIKYFDNLCHLTLFH